MGRAAGAPRGMTVVRFVALSLNMSRWLSHIDTLYLPDRCDWYVKEAVKKNILEKLRATHAELREIMVYFDASHLLRALGWSVPANDGGCRTGGAHPCRGRRRQTPLTATPSTSGRPPRSRPPRPRSPRPQCARPRLPRLRQSPTRRTCLHPTRSHHRRSHPQVSCCPALRCPA